MSGRSGKVYPAIGRQRKERNPGIGNARSWEVKEPKQRTFRCQECFAELPAKSSPHTTPSGETCTKTQFEEIW